MLAVSTFCRQSHVKTSSRSFGFNIGTKKKVKSKKSKTTQESDSSSTSSQVIVYFFLNFYKSLAFKLNKYKKKTDSMRTSKKLLKFYSVRGIWATSLLAKKGTLQDFNAYKM